MPTLRLSRKKQPERAALRKNDPAEYCSVHHPWGVIRPQPGRENIDGRLTRTAATARRWAWEVEHD